MIVMMDHRIMSKAQLPCRGFEQAFDGGKIAGLLDFSQKRRREIQRVRVQTFVRQQIAALQPFTSSLPSGRSVKYPLSPPSPVAGSYPGPPPQSLGPPVTPRSTTTPSSLRTTHERSAGKQWF